MKREDVKNKIPGITEEQLNWIMQENGADINREKSAATALQTQLDNANAQLKTAQDGLKAFDGVNVAGLQEQVTKLKADIQSPAWRWPPAFGIECTSAHSMTMPFIRPCQGALSGTMLPVRQTRAPTGPGSRSS